MTYKISKELVTRDIDGIFFIVDITNKHCFDLNRIYSLNQTAKIMFDIMNDLTAFTLEEVFERFIPELLSYRSTMKSEIMKDLLSFINTLLDLEYIEVI